MTNSSPSNPPSKPVVETSPDLGIITPVFNKIVFNSRLRGCNEKVLCIDPGTEKSGVVIIDYKREEDGDRMAVIPLGSEVDNDEVLYILHDNTYGCNTLAIEMVGCYGMAVGASTFETCVWIGRFIERFKREHKFIYRKDVKLNLCNSMRAKDANVRQALLDRFEPTGGGKTPQIGTKKQPGPLFGMSSHQWSALAVGITYMESREV